MAFLLPQISKITSTSHHTSVFPLLFTRSPCSGPILRIFPPEKHFRLPTVGPPLSVTSRALYSSFRLFSVAFFIHLQSSIGLVSALPLWPINVPVWGAGFTTCYKACICSSCPGPFVISPSMLRFATRWQAETHWCLVSERKI